MSTESELSEVEFKYVPTEIFEAGKNISLNLLPEKSKKQYTHAYNEFKTWRNKNNTSLAEEDLLVYFNELSKNLAPSTMWARYSMIKATIKTYDNIDISSYKELIGFLKKNNSVYTAKQSIVFTSAQVEKFCNEAPDYKFLATKVVMIVGITGACRREEITNISTKDVEDHKTILLIKIHKTKANIKRSFTITGESYNTCIKYMELRPKHTKNDRFFLNYQNGKCTTQPIGINKIGGIPAEVATFLELPNPKLYTGHCFRRTSATLLADSGADIMTIKRHVQWKSNTVTEGCIEDPLDSNKKIGHNVLSSISLNPSTSTTSANEQPNKRFKINVRQFASTSTSQTESEEPEIVGLKEAETDAQTFTFDADKDENPTFCFNNCNNITINIILNKKDE